MTLLRRKDARHRGAGRGGAAFVIQNPDVITAILAAVHSDKWFIPAIGPPIENPQIARAAA